MLRRLLSAVALILAASLSASDAAPGQHLTLSVGVEGCVGTLAVDPLPGLIASSAPITSTAHVDRNLAVQVQPDAWPGVRHLIVRCGNATAEARLNVVDAGAVVYVPWATRSPAE